MIRIVAHLGRAGDRTAREQRPEDSRAGRRRRGARPRPSRSAARRSRTARRRRRRTTPREPGRGDAPEVVAEQVDDHRVLGPVLHRAQQGSRIASSSASHRPRGAVPFIGRVRDRVAVDPEEQLGRGRQDAEAAGVQVGGVGAALRVAQVAVEAARVAARPSRGAAACGSPGRCRRRRCARGSRRSRRRSVARSIDGRPRRRVRGRGVRRRLRQRGLLAPLEHREPREGQRPRRGRRRRGRGRASAGSSPGAASYATNPATHSPRAAAASAASSTPGTSSGVRGLEHAGGLDEPEARLGAGQVVEPRLDHAGTIRG